MWKWELVIQSCPTLGSPMDCSPPGSSVHRILQARILEWVAIPFSRGSSRPRNWIGVSCIAGRYFTVWATRNHHELLVIEAEQWLWGTWLYIFFALLCNNGKFPSEDLKITTSASSMISSEVGTISPSWPCSGQLSSITEQMNGSLRTQTQVCLT